MFEPEHDMSARFQFLYVREAMLPNHVSIREVLRKCILSTDTRNAGNRVDLLGMMNSQIADH